MVPFSTTTHCVAQQKRLLRVHASPGGYGMDASRFSEYFNHIVSVEIPMSLECNLRCKYCYITDPHFKTTPVSLVEVNRVIDAVLECFPAYQKEGETGIIPWGAEPGCNWAVIEEALRYAFSLPIPSRIVTGWSTNLTILNRRMLDFIREYCDRITSLQVSIDGDEEVHDYSRRTVNGNGTYRIVRSNLDLLLKECECLASRIVYKSTLHPEQLELLHYSKAVEFFLTELKLKTDPVTIVNDRPYTRSQVSGLKESFDILKKRWDKIKAKNEDAMIGYFRKIMQPDEYHCSAYKTQVAVDINGNIYPCHEPTTSSSFSKNAFLLGNVFNKTVNPKGIMVTINLKYNISAFRTPLCKNCEVYHIAPQLCFPCPFDALRSTSSPFLFPISSCYARKAIVEKYQEWMNDGLL